MGSRRNWRDIADYAFTEELSFLGWGWEFLRRNPDYQRDYKLLTASADEQEKFYKINAIYGDKSYFEICEIKWCLMDYVNPEEDHPNLDVSLSGIPSHQKYGLDYMIAEMRETHDQPNIVWFKFDLNYKISGQIKRAEHILKQRSEAIKIFIPVANDRNDFDYSPENINSSSLLKTKKKEWRTYLQILDAEDFYDKHNNENIRKNDIASIIFPDKLNEYEDEFPASSKYRKSLKAGVSMRDSNFKVLFASHIEQ